MKIYNAEHAQRRVNAGVHRESEQISNRERSHRITNAESEHRGVNRAKRGWTENERGERTELMKTKDRERA
eukprot:4534212-Lingulodinium_polyedra.AAC.1